ncbi:MAG: zf-HC2 domain-containing protein [Acidobacteriota bacterium]|nr:zf-HC2 domain-containing protein [Acidobacteriota bacterium]
MQHEFDNTFESLLRRTASRSMGEVLPENAAHLDADSISAFVENTLPDATRARFSAHLADCSDCRQILVNFALIQEAEESEIVETKAAVAKQPAWSERFARWFTLPNLGYAAAALVVLFVGVFAFVALQSRQQQPTEVAVQIENDTEENLAQKRRAARTQPVQPEPTVESTPEVLPEAANLADSGNVNSAENTNQNADQSPNQGLPPSYRVIRGETNGAETAPRQREPEHQRDLTRSTNTSNSAPNTSTTLAAAPPPTTTNNNQSEGETVAQAAPKPTNKVEPGQRVENKEQSQPAETQVFGVQSNSSRSPAATKNTLATRTVDGKTFQNLDGVWRDSAYNGQTTIMISRDSDEYKKLDAGLRSVAEIFRGDTVIVVWKGKAYRIR